MDWFAILTGITTLINALYTAFTEVGNARVAQAMKNDADQLNKLKTRISIGSGTTGQLITDLSSILNTIENRYGASVLGQKADKISKPLSSIRDKITAAYNDYSTSADRAPTGSYTYGINGVYTNVNENAKKIEQYSKQQEDKFKNAINEALTTELPTGVKIKAPYEESDTITKKFKA